MYIKLSILIPVYNAGENLLALLERIFHQRNPYVEVIAMNDGSTDKSLSYLNTIDNRHPGFLQIISRENKGAVLTRRELFDAASGEWIWIIDADDMITENAIEFLMSCLGKTDADLIMFDFYQHDRNGNRIIHQLDETSGKIFSGQEKKSLYKKIVDHHEMNSLWSKVFRCTCIDFDEDYSKYQYVRRANDKLQLLPIITNAETIQYIRKPLYIYNIVDGSLSHTFKEYTLTSVLMVNERLDQYLDLWGIREDVGHSFEISVVETVSSMMEQYIAFISSDPDRVKSFFQNEVAVFSYVNRCFSDVSLSEDGKRNRRRIACLKLSDFKTFVRLAKNNMILLGIKQKIRECLKNITMLVLRK